MYIENNGYLNKTIVTKNTNWKFPDSSLNINNIKQCRTNTVIFVAQTGDSDKSNTNKKISYHYTKFSKY